MTTPEPVHLARLRELHEEARPQRGSGRHGADLFAAITRYQMAAVRTVPALLDLAEAASEVVPLLTHEERCQSWAYPEPEPCTCRVEKLRTALSAFPTDGEAT